MPSIQHVQKIQDWLEENHDDGYYVEIRPDGQNREKMQ